MLRIEPTETDRIGVEISGVIQTSQADRVVRKFEGLELIDRKVAVTFAAREISQNFQLVDGKCRREIRIIPSTRNNRIVKRPGTA